MSAEIIRGLDLSSYHDPANGYVSHSRLRAFMERGPAYYYGCYVSGEIEREDTAALIFGQALEDLFQRGGEYFAEHYAVRPAHLKGNTKPGIAWKAAQGDRICITDDDYQLMLAMCASLRTCDKGLALINGADEQVTLRGVVFGLQMQARPDWAHLSDFGAYIVDLKTTKDLNDFTTRDGPAVYRYGYHVQAAIMRKLLEANGYPDASAYLFAVEKQQKPRRACFQVREDYLAWADRLLETECAKLKECLDTDTWPLGPDEVVVLSKPRWVRSDNDSGEGEQGAAE